VRTQIKFGAAAQFRARRAAYAAIEARAGPGAAAAAAEAWLRGAAEDVALWRQVAAQTDAVRRGASVKRMEEPL
jgi:hypothetical protein